VLIATLVARPSEIKLEENPDGTVKPIKVELQLDVKNIGDVPLRNLTLSDKLDVAAQNPQQAPLNWDEVAADVGPRLLKIDTTTPLGPGETRQGTWTWEIRGDLPLEFKTMVTADNPDSPGGMLMSFPRVALGPKKDKLLSLEIKKSRGAGTGPIIAGDQRTYDVTFQNLSSTAKLRIGPTTFMKVFGSVLVDGPEPFTKEATAPGIWSDDDFGPKEKAELRVRIRTVDDGSKSLETFKIRLFSSIEVQEADESWRAIDPKEMVFKSGTPQIADSVQNVRDPVIDAGINSSLPDAAGEAAIAGLESIGGFVGTMVNDGLYFVYSIEQNPSKAISAVLSAGTKLTSKAQFYSERLLPQRVALWWLTASENEREHYLFDLYNAMDADSKGAFALLKLGYEAVSDPIRVQMDRLADGYVTGNYTLTQDAFVRLSATMSTDGVTGEGLSAVTKLGAAELRKLFTQRFLREAVDEIKSPAFAKKAQALFDEDPATALGAKLPREARCVTGRGETLYGAKFVDEEMRATAAVELRESQRLRNLAADEQISIVIRDRDADSIRLLEEKISTLKPEEIKAKGISELDIEYFGAPEKFKGQAAVFEPPKWAEIEAKLKAKGIDPASEKGLKVLERYGDRVKEIEELYPLYTIYEHKGGFEIGFDGTLNGRSDLNFRRERPFQLGDGGVTKAGKKVYIPQTLDNESRWLSFTGDIDSVAILNADGSIIVDKVKMERIYRKLGEAIGDVNIYSGIGLPHGETASCIVGKLRDRYLWGVRDAWQYAPDGSIRLVRPVEALSGDGFLFMRGGYYGGDLAWTKLTLSTLEENLAKLVSRIAELDNAKAIGDLTLLKSLKNVEANYLSALDDVIAKLKARVPNP
jgi:hypothetical protein